jgi:hypothetical protein
VKVNKKIVFAVAYIVVALIGYTLFTKYSFSKYEEERAILEAEFAARFPSLKGFEPDYFFLSSVWGRNVVWVGLALVFGGLVVAFVLMTISDLLAERRKKNT